MTETADTAPARAERIPDSLRGLAELCDSRAAVVLNTEVIAYSELDVTSADRAPWVAGPRHRTAAP
jgi:hypothetical protein